MDELVPWPMLGQDLLVSLKAAFMTPRHLQAAFDSEDDCCNLITSFFPLMIEEDVRNAAAVLMVWSGNSGAAIKRARLGAVADVLARLPRGSGSISIHDSYSAISNSSSVMLLELGAKKKQKKYRDEPPDIRTKKADAERRKYARLLANYFKEAEFPVVQILRTVSDPEASWVHLFAARRANTLKNRYKVLKPMRDWLEVHRGYVFPRSVNDAIDYVQFRIDEGCGKTVPESVDIALGLSETLGRVPEPDRISADPLWKGHVKSWTAELAAENPPRKPAEMFTVAMLISMEVLISDEAEPLCARALAWVVLCMVWASLRCDDVQCVKPLLTTLSNYGLRMVLTKTKTTGSDKAHKEVMAFIHRTTSLTGIDWLGVGFEIWSSDQFRYSRDYQVMKFSANWEHPRRRFVPTEKLTSMIRQLLSMLKTPRHGAIHWGTVPNSLLLPDKLEVHFGGHSARNFMTSVAAVLGFDRDQRAFLGRWAMGMTSSEEYVRTSRQVVFMMQKAVNRSLVEGREVEYFDSDAIDSLAGAASAMGFNPLRIKKRHTVMNDLSGRNCLGGTYPALQFDRGVLDDWEEVPESLHSAQELVDSINDKLDQKKPEIPPKYFVTVSRRQGFRRLHLSGCFVRPSRCLEVRTCNEVGPDDFDAICRACKVKMAAEAGKDTQAESSSTATSSSTEPEDDEDDLM